MTEPLLTALAYELYAASLDRRPTGLISPRYPALTVENAYHIQRINRDRAQSMGHRLTGYKVGLTAAELMRSMEVEEPDYGCLYEAAELPEGGEAPFQHMFEPKVEGEIAFLLGRDIPPHPAARDVLASTSSVCAAFEFPETRIAGWRNRIVDTVADNSSAGRYMLSSRRIDPKSLDLAQVAVTLRKNRAILAQGSAAVILDNPLNSVAWLSNKLRSHGEALCAGQVILAGALCGAHLAAPGDRFDVQFDALGSLSVLFV